MATAVARSAMNIVVDAASLGDTSVERGGANPPASSGRRRKLVVSFSYTGPTKHGPVYATKLRKVSINLDTCCSGSMSVLIE
jgi:hypothetical protein